MTKRATRERIQQLARELPPMRELPDAQVVKLTKYNGAGGDVQHEWLMSDGTTLNMTNAESIHYSFSLDRRKYRE